MVLNDNGTCDTKNAAELAEVGELAGVGDASDPTSFSSLSTSTLTSPGTVTGTELQRLTVEEPPVTPPSLQLVVTIFVRIDPMVTDMVIGGIQRNTMDYTSLLRRPWVLMEKERSMLCYMSLSRCLTR